MSTFNSLDSEKRVKELVKALRDVTNALEGYVDTCAKYKEAYEHPLSAYDRAVELLEQF